MARKSGTPFRVTEKKNPLITTAKSIGTGAFNIKHKKGKRGDPFKI